jgi:hypothetical protein
MSGFVVNDSVIMNSIVVNNKTKLTSGTESVSTCFYNPNLFAVSTSTFSNLCKNYAVACIRVLSSAPLQLIADSILVRLSELDSCLVQKFNSSLLRPN